MATYQNLITQSMYDKQLDSGRGTLLHLCDDVIQQEVSSILMFSFLIYLPSYKRSLEKYNCFWFLGTALSTGLSAD